MQVFRIALVWTLRRRGVELQRRIVQRFESNLAGIEPGHRILAHQAEELTPRLRARARLVFEPERLKQGSLLFQRQVQESLAGGLLTVGVEPGQSHPKRILRRWIARHHE